MRHKLKGNAYTLEVWLDGELLDPKPSQDLCNHSPDGFNWGYGGSGCAQLALAIVLKLSGETAGYQGFKDAVISKLKHGESFNTEFEYERINYEYPK